MDMYFLGDFLVAGKKRMKKKKKRLAIEWATAQLCHDTMGIVSRHRGLEGWFSLGEGCVTIQILYRD